MAVESYRWKIVGLVLAVVLLVSVAVPAEAAGRRGKITPSDAPEEGRFGASLAMTDGTLVASAPAGFNGPGAVYTYNRTRFGWTEAAKLVVSDGDADDQQFGISVAIDDNTIAVGAYVDDEAGSNSGAVYVFTRTRAGWVQAAKLTASDAEDRDFFGRSVAVAQDTILVGADGDDDAALDSGAVYVFTRTNAGWVESAKLIPSDADTFHEFGESLAIEGNTFVAGAPGAGVYSANSEGAAYVYERSGAGWVETAKLTTTESDACWFDFLGNSVDISGSTIVVGAARAEPGGCYGDEEQSGQAHVFTRTGGAWAQTAVLTASDLKSSAFFGYSVGVSQDTIVVGAPLDGDISVGAAYLFKNIDGVWVEAKKLTAPDAGEFDAFGSAVDLDAVTIAVGAPSSDGAALNSGAVYLYSP